MTDEKTHPPIAVTMGDPAGIGPELCLHVLKDSEVLACCVPLVFGDAHVLERVAAECGLTPPAEILSLDEWSQGAVPAGPAVVDCRAVSANGVQPGRVQAECGRAAVEYIRLAVEAVLSDRVCGIATAPINKEAIQAAGFRFPGHTELIAELTKSRRVCMMLTSDELTVSLVTVHVGLDEMPQALSRERVLDVIELTDEIMRRRLGRPPRIAVCGLNPHAGERGLFGKKEEERFIEPAIEAARQKQIDVVGPLPADTAFVPDRRKQVDAFVCMYHDQGLIPFKMLAFDTGVNVTLGLPIVRTSVDHGTAFDIAWRGKANPQSLIQAVLLAVKLSTRQLA